MGIKKWSESSNRRLRMLLFQRRPVAEAALLLECSTAEVLRRMHQLGIVAAATGANPPF